MLHNAQRNFAKFHELDVNEVDEQRIEKTSLGVRGWSVADVTDYKSIDPEVDDGCQNADVACQETEVCC